MRAKDKKNLVKVGIFITLLSVVLMIMVVAIGKESSLFEEKIILRAHVQSAEALKPGAVVELKGMRVGYVDDILITGPDQVEIQLLIALKHLQWIRQDSKVEISNAGLVGDKLLQIKGGTAESPIFNPATDVLQYESSFDLKAMAEKGGSLADRAERVLGKFEILLEAIEPQQLALTVNGISTTTQNLAKATAPLSGLLKKLEQSGQKMDAILTRIEKGPGTTHALIYDDALHEDMRKLLGGAERNSVIKYFIRESIKKAPTKAP